MVSPFFLCTDPGIKPNLWMWVNPNIVYPPGKLEVRRPKRVLKEEEASCSEASGAQLRLPSASQPSPPHKQRKQKHTASSPSTWKEVQMSGHRVEASAVGCLRASKKMNTLRTALCSRVGEKHRWWMLDCSLICHCILEQRPRSQDQILLCAPLAYRRGGGQGPG